MARFAEMNGKPTLITAENPFSTRRVRPGGIDFHFLDGMSVSVLVDGLRRARWWGQIVGPHGSGKSTLLCALVPQLERMGRRIESVTLRQGQRRVPWGPRDARQWTSDTQIVIDGYEQLGWTSRMRLKSMCRRAGCGLLVTSHRSVGLPELLRVQTSLDTALRVVENLLDGDWSIISPEDVTPSFAKHAGNMREVLFDLYDHYESRRGRQAQRV